MQEQNKNKLNRILNKYKIEKEDKKILLDIINPIFNHNEFQRRMTDEFPHHGRITLGEHILEDTIVTYLICKKKKDVDINLAIKISMLHDLYTFPWQNNKKTKVKKFYNKHGFRHPIEAVINSIFWFPEFFKEETDSKIIIDGILHHMYPLPVRVYDENNMELRNDELINKISLQNKKIIINSLNRNKLKKLSFSKSIYKEGRIMSKADKKVSRKQIKNFSTLISLITGHNKLLKSNT